MPRLLGLVATLGIVCWGSQVAAAELIKFSQPGLGLTWNVGPTELQATYPGTKPLSQRSAAYQGPLNIDTLNYQEESVIFSFDAENRLSRIYCEITGTDAAKLILLLNSKLGPARWATYQDARLYQHVYEWSSETYTLELSYAGLTPDALVAPREGSGVQLSLLRDRPRVSRVDAALSIPRQREELAKQVADAQRAQREQREARRAEAERLKSLPVNAAERPALRKAESTWGSIFNPTNEAPLGKFKAFYFDTDRPRVAVGSEVVADVAINYAWDQFLKIKSENFGGYWVARIKVPRAETRVISVSQGHAKTRIIIDGLVAFEGRSAASVPYEFSRGEHRVEVEHVNNWHTTDFKVTFANNAPSMTSEDIRSELARLQLDSHEVQYVGVYESRNRDLSIALSADMLQQDSVLVLSSYSAIKWSVRDPKSRIKAVIVGSHEPSTEVIGLPSRVPLMRHKSSIGSYSIETKCRCAAGHFHCENEQSLEKLQAAVGKLSAGKLTGFSGAYGVSEITLPGAALDQAAIESDRRKTAETQVLKSRCERKADPDFERMLQ